MLSRLPGLFAADADRLTRFKREAQILASLNHTNIAAIQGFEEVVVPGTPYIIPYRLRGDRLEVVAVFHGRQKWPQRL